MSQTSDGGPFTTSRRRAVASACRTPKTRQDLARIFGGKRGGVESVLQALVKAEVLEGIPVGHARATGFQLREEWQQALADATEAAHPPGLLSVGLRLLLISARQPGAVEQAVHAALAEPHVVWATRVDGQARFLIAVQPEAGSAYADRLQAVIAQTGLECLQVVVTETMDRQRFVQYGETITERSHIPAILGST